MMIKYFSLVWAEYNKVGPGSGYKIYYLRVWYRSRQKITRHYRDSMLTSYKEVRYFLHSENVEQRSDIFFFHDLYSDLLAQIVSPRTVSKPVVLNRS